LIVFYYSQITPQAIEVKVDTSVFNDTVISKVLYWLSDDYLIEWQREDNNAVIRLESKSGEIDEQTYRKLKHRLNQDFIDFKTRDIVHQETKTIWELLLVKAFANNDDFDEEDLISTPE